MFIHRNRGGFRLRLGSGVSLRLRSARRSSPADAPLPPLADTQTEAQSVANANTLLNHDFQKAIRVIWDSRDSWALSPLWDKYADELNTAKVKEIDADWAKHCLVKVFYNPLFRGDTFDKISWLADSRDH